MVIKILIILFLITVFLLFLSALRRRKSKDSDKFAIEKTYFINLEKRKTKADKTVQQLKKSNHPNFVRFNAIDGAFHESLISMVSKYQNINFDPKNFLNENIRNTRRYRAKLACWLSHYLILKENQHRGGNKWIIVLEDDIETNYRYDQLLENIAQTLYETPGADMIVLSNRIGICDEKDQDLHIKMYGKRKEYGTDGYAIRCEVIKKLLPHLKLDHTHTVLSIDNKLKEMNRKRTIKIVPLKSAAYINCDDIGQKNSDIEIGLDE